MARGRWMVFALAVGCGPGTGGGDDALMSGTGIAEGSGTSGTTGTVDASGTDGGPTTVATTTDPTGDTVDPDSGTDTNATDGATTGGSACGPSHPCEVPVDCGMFECGELGSWFDEAGCIYPPCSFKLNCPDDGVCFFPQEWGLCASSGVSCSDENGTCECAMDDDCGGRFCMPAGTAPPTQCNEIDDEMTCTDAGCSHWIDVRPVLAVPTDACLCELEVGQCVWISPDATVTVGTAVAYYNWLSGEVFAFPDRYDPPPAGWVDCEDLGFSTPECDCAAMLPCAM